MSRPMTEEEYNKRLFNRVKRWVMGEADPYLGRVEIKEQKENTLSPEVLEQHKKDRELTLKEVHDTEKNKIYRKFFRFYRIAAVLCCVALIAMLLVAVSYLPPVGNADNPAHNEVVAKYIEDGMQDTGAVNIVTGMILDYRAFDTFGESNVLFIATCTVLILLRNDKKNEKKKAEWEAQKDSLYEPGADSILQKITFLLFPIIVIFGIYVVLNGHLSPGGGFSGGAIIGAGLILYVNAFGFEKTQKFFTEKTYKWISFCALSFYCLAKSYSFYTGAHHLESGIPLGTAGDIISSGLILPLNICVGMVVACTMYAFYALFRKGGF
ncbi:MAG: hydrogen gas-evolving membrane-bound hydrogenase subunit E [Ruminococcus sp.]|nr:hydrogen gas-evolving membrane-bound hydrogenase subunit E [Ruminococcus sp.]